jgi:hypothetical protein
LVLRVRKNLFFIEIKNDEVNELGWRKNNSGPEQKGEKAIKTNPREIKK